MISQEIDFVRALRAFSMDPGEDHRRDLLVACVGVGEVVDDCRWPMMVASAMTMVSALSEVRDDTPRLISLASIAGDYAVILALHIEKFEPPALPENTVEHDRPKRPHALKVPETPAAPIRQYKDD